MDEPPPHPFAPPATPPAGRRALHPLAGLALRPLQARFGVVPVLGVYALINGLVAIGVLSAAAMATGVPLVFPSLGPTAYLLFTDPLAVTASPRNAVLGHLIGVAAGWTGLAAFGLLDAADMMAISPGRVGAAATSLALTSGLVVWTATSHPPAAATTLIVSLGILHEPGELVVLLLAVVLLVVLGLGINGLAGVPYPAWRAPCRCGAIGPRRGCRRVNVAPDDRPSTSSDALFDRAQQVIPGGVNSPVRAFRGVGGTPRFMARGQGARVTDVDATSYLDYVMSWGPLILGHSRQEVVDAAVAATRAGSSFGAPTAGEVELAEEIVARVPGVEMIRCVSSGTEATMSAIRVARGATGRDKVVKFAGHYHGHADSLLVEAGSGVATLGLPNSPGVTRGATADTVVVAWNDVAAVEQAFAAHGDDIAVVVCEPVAANMGLVPAADGFHAFLRDITRRHGALLLIDEVMTGFRLARGGATELLGLEGDLVAFGKVVGGGFPLAAFGGSRELMAHLAPTGPVYQAGTLSGNPVAVAAGLAQLRLLDDAAYEVLDARATQLIEGWTAAFAAAGVPVQIPRVASLFALYFTDAPVTDYDGARAADHDRYATFFHGMLERGVYLPPSGYEAVFVSTAHSTADIDATVDAAREVASTLV